MRRQAGGLRVYALKQHCKWKAWSVRVIIYAVKGKTSANMVHNSRLIHIYIKR